MRPETDPAIRELVGRLFMIGFAGQDFSPTLRELLLEIRPGCLILFRRNVGGGPRQVAALTRACQDLARAEFGRALLIAIDQEGGPVQRLGPPFTPLPSQREMAGHLGQEFTRELARTSGRELAAVGVNFNLTPVLDLNIDPQARFMFERSFAADPDVAAVHGLAVIQGHAEQGVLTCAKHFPGIGDTRVDPHFDLPTVAHGAERLRAVELVPFSKAFAAGVAAVMTSHIRYPALDPDEPVTFSRLITTDLLRRELGFSGLVLCDDLEMGAIIKNYRIGPAAVRTVLAGNDLLLVCQDPDRIREAHSAVLEAVRRGEISLKLLEESAVRLDRAREATGLVQTANLAEVFPSGL